LKKLHLCEMIEVHEVGPAEIGGFEQVK
jgi:hypothetical protein